MKKIILLTLVTIVGLSHAQAGVDAYASEADSDKKNYVLENLDSVLKTCQTPIQKETAHKALGFMFNFRWWQIKNLMKSIHKDYTAWHASRVYNGLYVAKMGGDISKQPFGNGLVTKAGYIKDLATIAYTNEVPKYIVSPTRLECVGSDTVVVTALFSGLSVKRDDEGYVIKTVALEKIPTRFTLVLKDGLIYKNIIDLADATTLDLGAKFAKAPVLTRQQSIDLGYETANLEKILADFKAKAAK